MRDRIKLHVEWLQTLPMLPFSLILAGYVFVLRLVPVIIAATATLVTGADLPMNDAPFLMAVALAPIVETLTFQWLPIAASSRLTTRTPVILGISTTLFATAHYDAGILSMLVAAPAGFVLAWAFMAQRDKGIWTALWTTALVHMWVNLGAEAIRLIPH